MPEAVVQQVVLEGCLNFRDLGGMPTRDGRRVRTGRLYRSDALHHLTPADVACIRDDLGIGVVIDLRSTFELRSEGQGPLEAEPLAFHHVPLYDGDTKTARAGATSITLAERYVLLAEIARPAIARVVELIATAPSAVVYHCAAGKDRTGVISAILLGLLGVDDDLIVADYATTRDNLDAIVDRLRSTKGYRAMLDALPPDTMHAEPETMRTFLTSLQARHGTFRSYAEAAGVPASTLDQLVHRLID